MPLYEYRCKKCEHIYEKIQKFSDKPEAECPECGGEGKRLLSAPAVHFKGTGWYVTDYARKGQKGDSDKESDGKKKDEKKSSSDTKGSSSDSKSKSTPSEKKTKKD